MKLAAIHVYPVKSMAGQAVDHANVEPWGLRHDRRWVVLEPDGTRLSAREEHRMLGLTAISIEGGVQISTRDRDCVDVLNPIDGEIVSTSVSRLESVRLANG
ncbi:MAG TPA: MOSC N-terminal beta barrel domain-containing protein, partial [Candidatus Limnocylindrales bacterium]